MFIYCMNWMVDVIVSLAVLLLSIKYQKKPMKEIGKQKIFYWINLREKEKGGRQEVFFLRAVCILSSVFCLSKNNEIDWLSPN